MQVYILLIFEHFGSWPFALPIGTHKSRTIFQFQISLLHLQIFFAQAAPLSLCVYVCSCSQLLALSETDLFPINMLRARRRPKAFRLPCTLLLRLRFRLRHAAHCSRSSWRQLWKAETSCKKTYDHFVVGRRQTTSMQQHKCCTHTQTHTRWARIVLVDWPQSQLCRPGRQLFLAEKSFCIWRKNIHGKAGTQPKPKSMPTNGYWPFASRTTPSHTHTSSSFYSRTHFDHVARSRTAPAATLDSAADLQYSLSSSQLACSMALLTSQPHWAALCPHSAPGGSWLMPNNKKVEITHKKR